MHAVFDRASFLARKLLGLFSSIALKQHVGIAFQQPFEALVWHEQRRSYVHRLRRQNRDFRKHSIIRASR